MNHQKKRSLFAMLILVLAIIFSACTQKPSVKEAKVEQPNVVLIFVDDMGYGDLSCYGHPTISTPKIDQLADEGIKLTSFYVAASVCTPSRASLLTGRYPVRHLPHNLGPESDHGLPESEITIANVLKDVGYQTMAVGKWHLGHKKPFLPTSRGFDHFYGLPYSNDMILPWCPWLTEKDTLKLYVDENPVKEVGFNQENLTVDYTKEAVKFIETNQDRPFFLYLAHSMPHLPISTSKEFIGKSKAGLYGDVIETIDWSVGEITKTLEKLGIADNTLLIFTSDNGPWQNLPERMLQRGVEPWHGGNTGLLRGWKNTTYEGGMRVPAMIRWPGHIPAKQVSSELANSMDLFVTIAEATGGKVPTDREIDGNNILDFLKGDSKSPDQTFFFTKGEQVEAVRDGDWKLRVTKEDGVQLFNLAIDPSEKYNMAENEKELLQTMYQKMVDFSKQTKSELIPLTGE